MIDPFGREVSYLRVSVTDRCDFRCVYCMSEEMEFLPKGDLLSLEELDRLCSAFVDKGVNKLRITGGEPLVRRDIMSLFKSLSRHLDSGALKDLTLTTNGSQLTKYADELASYGIKRVNVSVDSLDPEKFRRITRRGDLAKVLDGITAAKEAGLHVKINTVALKGTNDDEMGQRIGFITPLSHNFCESCNRVRITCTGTLYMCLGQMDSADLRKPLRMSESDEALSLAIDEAIGRKPKGHDFVIDRDQETISLDRHMSVTGG